MNARWFVEIAVTSFGLLAVAACATGSSQIGSGGEGGEEWTESGSSSSSSSSNSGGAAGSSSNGGGGAGGSSASSSSSSSGTCEMPCQLAPQCGCNISQACVVDGSGTRSCVAAGSSPIGSQCASPSACVAGGFCLQTAPGIMTCNAYCSSDAQCTAPGGLCVINVNGTSSGVIATLCSENCDLVTNVGCPVAGMACRLGIEPGGSKRVFSLCAEAGPGTLGASCSDNSNCAAGFRCFTGTCRKYCKAVGTTCPTGGTCTTFKLGVDMKDPTIGNTTYGVCL